MPERGRVAWRKVSASVASCLLVFAQAVAGHALEGFDAARWDSSEALRIQTPAGRALLSGIARRGGPDHDVNDLLITDPDTVGSVAARVTLVDVDDSGAAGAGRPRAGLAGCFYWDGAGSGLPGDWTGHVLATLTLGPEGQSGAIRAQYAVTRCVDTWCGQEEVLAAGSLGADPLRLFESHVLTFGYDGDRFLFQLDTTAPVELVAPDPRRSSTPNSFRALRTEAGTNDRRARANVLALFERVYVNGALYDDFDASSPPWVQITPGSGRVASTQTVDVLVLVDAGTAEILGGRLLVNGQDIGAGVAPSAIVEALADGRTAVRFPNVRLGQYLAPDRSVVLAAEVRTAAGVGRDSAVWQLLEVTEP
jgi:hypothetical protein